MEGFPWSIGLFLLGISLLSGCDLAYPTQEWGNPGVDHSQVANGFVLPAGHSQVPCGSCHARGTFVPLFDPADANDCVACHQSDYDGEHEGSGYPTSCVSCHTPTDWGNGTFDHDTQYFPIFSEDHRNKWSGCNTCHIEPTDFSVFTCFECHKHNQTSMDEEHEGRSGYVYSSPTCLSCHPNGSGD